MKPWVLSLVVAFGCHARVPQAAVQGGKSPNASTNATTAERLVAEGLRELHAMKSTRYRHKTHVDEANGVFEYDCSGFVVYALGRTSAPALAALPIGPKGRSRAEQFAIHFSGLVGEGPWVRVARAEDVRGGDVIAWTKPAEIEGSDTGHVVIALEPPKRIAKGPAPVAIAAIGGASEWLVRVVDSTESPHADDARSEDSNGLGVGTIGVVVDGAGTPIGYRWKGGRSPKAYATMIAIGRPR